MMISLKRIEPKLLAVFVMLIVFAGCSQDQSRFFMADSEDGEKEILKWSKKKDIVTLDFLKMSNDSCYLLYNRMVLKPFPNAIALRQNKFWTPYVYFDQAKAAVYGSPQTNYNGFVKNKLIETNKKSLIISQEVENLDGENDYYLIEYTNDLIPISIQRYDGNKFVIIYAKSKEINDPKICVNME